MKMPKVDYSNMISLIRGNLDYPRFAGTEGSAKAREFIEYNLKKYGYNFKKFVTQVPNWSIEGCPTIEFLAPEKFIVKGIPALLSPPTLSEGIEGKIIEDGVLTMLESFDWNRYAIVSKDNQIQGYLISTSYGAQMQPIPLGSQSKPHVILDSGTLEKLQHWIQSGMEVQVRVVNPTKISNKIDAISIVTEEPSSKPYTLVCAHYDTVFGSNGAHDNGSGVAVALSLAEELFSSDNPCRFAFFDGEELNTIGSQSFVAEEKRKDTLKNISLILEIDSVGIGNEIALLCSKQLYKKLKKLDSGTKILFEEHKLSVSRQTKIGFSDVWPFMQEGILVIRMLTRGDVGSNVMHTEDDKVDNINENTLISAFNVANAIVTQFR
jgi:hypothetical protein